MHFKPQPNAGFSQLDNDTIRVVYDFLDDTDCVSLSMTSRYAQTFFRKNLFVRRLRRKLFKCFGFGQREKAMAILQQYPTLWEQLLCKKDLLVDCGDRYFQCTVFQYALWALDRFSWEIIEKHLNAIDGHETARQLLEFEEANGLTYTFRAEPQHLIREKHYNFNELILPLRTISTLLPVLHGTANWRQIRTLCNFHLPAAQFRTVAHIRQEYSRPDRPFAPTPVFDETIIPDEASYLDWEKSKKRNWLSMTDAADTPAQRAIKRNKSNSASIFYPELTPNTGDEITLQSDALSALQARRLAEYTALRDSLLNRPADSYHP